MGAYSSDAKVTIVAAKSSIGVQQPSSALKRLKLFYMQIGSSASADNAADHLLKRTTTAGTSTSFTPTLLDPADGPASAVSGNTFTAEPTTTSNSELIAMGAHQRAVYQWYSAPDAFVVVPVTNSAGLIMFCNTAATGFSTDFTMQWFE